MKQLYNKVFLIFKFAILIVINLTFIINLFFKKHALRLAICTMAKEENLYINEFIKYYIELGFDHINIFDDNEYGFQNISEVIDSSFNKFVTIYDYRNIIKDQKAAFTLCYELNKNKYDWIFMNDIDEFLVIRNDTLKHYLSGRIFKKCDFIKFHWVLANDNDLLHYDNRSLFERFKGPYKPNALIKTIVRGNIDDIQFDIHTPMISPHKNVSCNNMGEIYNDKEIFFQYVSDINIQKAYIIHFKYKSTEEFIKKYKRGYRWYNEKMIYMINRIREYFSNNKPTIEKFEYIEKELHLNLSILKEHFLKSVK